MTAVRVVVREDHMNDVDAKIAWADPVIEALAELTGEDVMVDSDGDLGAIATIGQGAWTIVIDLPAAATTWLNRRYDHDERGEPFDFEIEIPTWVSDLVRDDRPFLTLRQAAAILHVSPVTLRQLAGRDASEDENSPRARRLRPVKLGRDWFVDRLAVEAEARRAP